MNETPIITDKFNIRVYGVCIRDSKVLLVRENLKGFEFTKFPGGGLEFGEGLTDGLKREIMEELQLEADILGHFYTTDFFQQSAFYKNEQLLSVYYLIDILKCPDFINFPLTLSQNDNHSLTFYWQDIVSLDEQDVTFPIDKIVAGKLKISN